VETPKIPEGDELRDLLRRAAEGDESTLPVVREYLKRPGALEAYGDMGRAAQQTLIKVFTGKHLVNREAMLARLEQLREELAGPDPTPLERLLAERIVACQLHLDYLELNYSLQMEKGDVRDMKTYLLYEGCINRAHHRTLAAVRTLALVRKLALPVLVNVSAGGGQGNGRGPRIPVARNGRHGGNGKSPP
jgi:hypothetical protein